MSAPVKHTCPDIDRLIKSMKELIRTCEYEIDGFISALEDLRRDNAELRNWGEGLEEELEAANDKIYELENNITP